MQSRSGFLLNPDLRVTQATPLMFLLQNEDDPMDSVEDSLSYCAVLKAGVAVKMHLYAHGGHALGLRRTRLPATRWPELVNMWLRTIGMVAE